jgi:hypothetical protein
MSGSPGKPIQIDLLSKELEASNSWDSQREEHPLSWFWSHCISFVEYLDIPCMLSLLSYIPSLHIALLVPLSSELSASVEPSQMT